MGKSCPLDLEDLVGKFQSDLSYHPEECTLLRIQNVVCAINGFSSTFFRETTGTRGDLSIAIFQ